MTNFPSSVGNGEFLDNGGISSTSTSVVAVDVRVSKQSMIPWAGLNRSLLPKNVTDWVDLSVKDRLIKSILKNDIIAPIAVWQPSEGGDIFVLKGVGFLSVLDEIENSGIGKIPVEIPAFFVECADEAAAKKCALLLRSKYREFDKDGLSDFMKMEGLNWAELKTEMRFSDLSEARFDTMMDIYNIDKLSEQNTDDDLSDDDDDDVNFDIVVSLGDVFECRANGIRHFVGCGNIEDEAFVDGFFGGYVYGGGAVTSCCVITDSPYNLKTSFFCNNKNHDDFQSGGGEMSDEEFIDFIALQYRIACRYTVPGSIHYYCMDFRHATHMGIAAKKVYGRYDAKQICVWNKNNFGNGDFYRAKHELVFIYKHGNEKHKSHIGMKERVRSNVWDYPIASSYANPDRDLLDDHPTPKPVQLYCDAMLDVTDEGDTVLDFFAGSGTCLVAGQQVKRHTASMDIMPKYVQKTLRRWVKHCMAAGYDCEIVHVNGELDMMSIIKQNISANG